MQLVAARVATGALLWLALCAAAQAQSPATVDVRSSLYLDDDDTTIVTSTVAARGRVLADRSLTLTSRYLADVITTASIDVVTHASQRNPDGSVPAWHEVRHEATAGIGFDNGTTSVSGSYIYSTENDWYSHTATLGVSQDFLSHDLRVALGASYVDNTVLRKSDYNFEEKLQQGGASLTLVGVANPNNILSLGYGFSWLEGFQASPYRYAALSDPSVDGQVFWTTERHPERRLRHSVTLRHNVHLFQDSALRSHLRLYTDDWGIRSVTAGTEYVHGLGHFEPAVFVRGYVQSHTAFYQDVYAAPQRYMTADRELSGFGDLFAGLRLGYALEQLGPLEVLRLEAKLTGFSFWFPEFHRLPRRLGLVAELAAGVEF